MEDIALYSSVIDNFFKSRLTNEERKYVDSYRCHIRRWAKNFEEKKVSIHVIF